MDNHNLTYIKDLCEFDTPDWICEQIATELDTRDGEIESLKSKLPIQLHKALLTEEIYKLRAVLQENYILFEKLLIEEGTLTDIVRARDTARLHMARPIPQEPIPSQRIFGG